MDEIFEPLDDDVFTVFHDTGSDNTLYTYRRIAWFGPDDLVTTRFRQDIEMTPMGLLYTEDYTLL